ncbi:hypothetical protein T265_06893 [Opisthorchis viverrini]|uniref:Uncharacterized protein n=1 Tax=Opisthorchis viverrini TaxID=6198 RepID=A0A074ZEM0_OPIVI|nr:hypothetical protein T265_06893 [Opisthorchis viverrini]KER25721.1 hypothetical protein T265_06893 [Opisthorchis viverrini]
MAKSRNRVPIQLALQSDIHILLDGSNEDCLGNPIPSKDSQLKLQKIKCCFEELQPVNVPSPENPSDGITSKHAKGKDNVKLKIGSHLTGTMSVEETVRYGSVTSAVEYLKTSQNPRPVWPGPTAVQPAQ